MPTSPNEFPRGSELPSQSPLFWVANKDRYLRQLLLADTEKITGRGLIVMFHGRWSPNAYIDQTDIAPLAEMLSRCDSKEFDLLLQTPGGMVDATEAICMLLQNQKRSYRVIVPAYAKSGGTVISLSASQIVMGPTSELGPVDPSLGIYPAEFLGAIDSERLKEIADLQQDAGVAMQVEKLIWEAQQAARQSQSLAEKMLRIGVMKGQPEDRIKETAKILATREKFNSHGSAIDSAEAVTMGLNVEILAQENDLWKRYWMIWNMYNFDSEKFKQDKIFECSSATQFIEFPQVQATQ